MKTHIHFLDNLRTLMIFLVVVLHAGIVYEPIMQSTWIVSDPVKSPNLGLLRMYLDLFVMFTIFFISGYLIPVSVKNKSWKQFITSKFNRIMLPWLLGVLILIPLYKVVFLASRGLPQDLWYSYFHIFSRENTDPWYFADNPTQSWLWFLPVLFIFQMFYLVLHKAGMLRVKISMKGAVALTVVLATAYGMIISELGLMGWHHSALLHFQNERLGIYFLSFLLGSLSYKLNVLDTLNRGLRMYIISNVVMTISIAVYTIVGLNLFFNMIEPGRNYYFVNLFADRLIYYFSAILSMLTILHVMLYSFNRYFNKANRIFAELNRNSYAVYIIHLIVLGTVALIMLPYFMPAIIKFILLTLLTFVISNLLVSVYRVISKKYFANPNYKFVVPATAVLFSVVVLAAQPIKPEKQSNQDEISQSNLKDLQMAVIENDVDAIKAHIQAGSDLNAVEPTGGSTPLITAALFGSTESVRLLIEAGADINFQNKDGSTALHTAAFFCRPAIVDLLLKNGIDTSIINNSGATALQSVEAPFAAVKPVYEYFQSTLGPLGLNLDLNEIEKTRPQIVEMLK